jgi:MoxR-like ATPase
MTATLEQVRAELVAAFPERESVIDGVLAATLAGEHVLLLGPPGTGKSALVRAVAAIFEGRYFEQLLTKFSTPEELFGPISLKALEQDQFTRVVTGKLPDAEFAFIDEVFKANSAILNSLLSVLNERLFHNAGQPVQCPLVSLFGASNELPEGKELEALFDRFLLRFDVGYLVRTSNLRTILLASDPAPTIRVPFSTLRSWQADARRVTVTDGTVDALISIRETCRAEGIVASDRRWKKSLRLVQATAYLSGATETTSEDLAVLIDSLWREPKERTKVARLVGPIVDPVGFSATEILDAALEEAAKLGQVQAKDRQGYLAQAGRVLESFRAQEARLAELAQKGGRRAKAIVDDARKHIQQMHGDLARNISKGLGLGGRSVH